MLPILECVTAEYHLYFESVSTTTLYLSQHVSVHFDHLQVIFKYPNNKTISTMHTFHTVKQSKQTLV
jgi:nitrate reductase assembly molybdenum cofactor insertion protein NarJ